MTQPGSCPCMNAASFGPGRASAPKGGDDRAAGRGVVYGVLIGVVFWTLIFAAIQLLG